MVAFRCILLCLLLFSNYSLVFSRVGFKVKFTTWNVNEKRPIEKIEDLASLKGEAPDLYAFALQEVNPKANPASGNDERWINALGQSLAKNGYDVVGKKSIDGSLVVVFAKRGMMSDISNVDSSSKRLGALGVVGNKGASAVRFEFKGTAVCFVGSHFHAHDNQVQKRYEDYRSINAGIIFNKAGGKRIVDHDLVFWAGDLNFRIDDLPTEEVVKIIKTKQTSEAVTQLMNRDQLKKAMKEGHIFENYVEGTPSFAPTYKYKIGTNNYDLKRKPAFTDRVLTRYSSGITVRHTKYESNEKLMISDHKPVTAEFSIQ